MLDRWGTAGLLLLLELRFIRVLSQNSEIVHRKTKTANNQKIGRNSSVEPAGSAALDINILWVHHWVTSFTVDIVIWFSMIIKMLIRAALKSEFWEENHNYYFIFFTEFTLEFLSFFLLLLYTSIQLYYSCGLLVIQDIIWQLLCWSFKMNKHIDYMRPSKTVRNTFEWPKHRKNNVYDW